VNGTAKEVLLMMCVMMVKRVVVRWQPKVGCFQHFVFFFFFYFSFFFLMLHCSWHTTSSASALNTLQFVSLEPDFCAPLCCLHRESVAFSKQLLVLFDQRRQCFLVRIFEVFVFLTSFLSSLAGVLLIDWRGERLGRRQGFFFALLFNCQL
jgi:hypothetical protein